MNLNELKIGKDAVVASVDCDEPSLRQHILDMGLTPGVEVTLMKRAPMGDPLEIRLRGYELTLRADDAAHIAIDQVHDAHDRPRTRERLEAAPPPGHRREVRAPRRRHGHSGGTAAQAGARRQPELRQDHALQRAHGLQPARGQLPRRHR